MVDLSDTSRKRSPTRFEQSVYDSIANIPIGTFTTYKIIADRLQSSPRAVGQALKLNPFAPRIPCHRVVSSKFELGGYHGEMNSCKKVELLRQEGIVVKDGFVVQECRKHLVTDWKE